MAGHAWILQAWPVAFLDCGIAMADATSLDLNSHPPGTRLRKLTLHKFERPARAGDLRCTHLWHNQVLLLEYPLNKSGTLLPDVNRLSIVRSPALA